MTFNPRTPPVQLKRVIGRYSGAEKGPLLICIGGMHGNEPAGIKALDLMFKMLEVEPITNPEFTFRGRLLGIRGNLRAIQQGKRFINCDLNRQWTKAQVDFCKKADPLALSEEQLEIREIITLIEDEIATYQPEKVIVLDLHTTTAKGGIFSAVTNDHESILMAVELHAPVITGMLEGLDGTSLHYFKTENMGVETVAICFESGQHEEPLSVNRAIAALTNCMRTIGCVEAEHIENRHDALLRAYTRNLPKVAHLLMCHTIQPGDNFVMKAGYVNFDRVQQGEVLAHDRHGEIRAQEDALLLMPLYQKQGQDGFFLIKEVKAYAV